MSGFQPTLVGPLQITVNHPIFEEIRNWEYADPFVPRLLANDLPRRAAVGRLQLWAYRDAASEIIGLGSLDLCADYSDQLAPNPHAYIPLIVVRTDCQGKGFGAAILRHLIAEAAILVRRSRGQCQDALFLDVYATSTRAIRLYEKYGFVALTESPLFDSDENQHYLVMAIRVSQASP